MQIQGSKSPGSKKSYEVAWYWVTRWWSV